MSPPNADVGKVVEDTYTKTGQHFQKTPQLLVFMLPDSNSLTYFRVKKSADCRYGVPSQCLQYSKAMKCQGQYISNVLLKVHCKLGGTVARANGPTTSTSLSSVFKVPTMIVGADVSHPPPMGQGAADEQSGSIAAITSSIDKAGVRYIADVNTNGWRQEMIQTENWIKLWKPMLLKWMSQVGGGQLPKVIYYMRDGIGEQAFAAVLAQEVKDMKDVIKSINPAADVKFVVCICTKRHHVRMFGQDATSADKNGNVLPGTVVETGVTAPYENDFFMVSHVALKGTARPAKLTVLMNEANISNEDIMTMVYEHCYQFSRSTTPVSLFPAVYYADIAAQRGRCHDKNFGSSAPAVKQASDSAPSTVAELLPLHGNVLSETMWWV